MLDNTAKSREVLETRTTNLCYDRLENRQKREPEPSFEPRENEGGPHSVFSLKE